MRILHTADWHIGAYAGPQCDDPKERMASTIRCLWMLVRTAMQEKPDLILVAGDLIHQAKTWSDRALVETEAAADVINQLSAIAPTAVLYGTPNHDNAAGFELMQRMCPSAVFFTEPCVKTIETFAWSIQVAGVPGIDRGVFRAQMPGLSAEDENRAITAATASIIAGLSAQLDPSLPAVLMAHHTVIGCTLDNGQEVIEAAEPVIEATTLDATAFDVVCLGHIHRQQAVMSCRKPVFYCGAINANTFGDEDNAPGFLIHDLLDDDAEQGRRWFGMKPVFTPARKFVTIRTSLANPTNEGKAVSDAIVRVLYSGTDEQERAMDRRQIERTLYAAGAEYVAEIRPESITATVNRERLHETLEPADCLRRYLAGQHIASAEADAIVDVAQPIIAAAMANAPAGGQTGTFLPLALEVVNYRSYATERLDFGAISFAMVNGRNGVGKSSLFMDALSDCLYEQPREGELTGWIRAGERSGSIMFTFRLGRSIWRVTRTRARSGKATLALAEMSHMDDPFDETNQIDDPFEEWTDHSAQRMVDTQQAIVNLLGMDAATFRSCVLIMQDAYGSFMEARPEDRMSVLANLLGLGIYENMEEAARARLAELNRTIRDLKASAEANATARAELAPMADRLASLREDHAIWSGRVAELRAQRDDVAAAAGNAANVSAELARANQALMTAQQQERDTAGRIAMLKRNSSDTEEFLAKAPELEAAHEQYLEAQTAVLGMQANQNRLMDMDRRLTAIGRELSECTTAETTISRSLADVDVKIRVLAEKQTILEELGDTDDALAAQDLLKAQHDALIRERDSIDVELTHAEQKSRSEINAAETALGLAERQRDMLASSNCIDIGRAECRFLAEAKLVASTLEERQKALAAAHDWIANYKAAHAGRAADISRRIGELGYSTGTHAMAAENVRTARSIAMELAQSAAVLARRNDLAAQLDQTRAKAEQLLQEHAALASEAEWLRPLCAGIVAAQSRMADLADSERKYGELPAARRYITDTMPEIEAAGKRQAELLASIEAAVAEVSRLSALAASAQDTTAALSEIDSGINRAMTTVSAIDREIGALEGQTARLQTLIDEAASIQRQITCAAASASRMQLLVDAFSQDGIPHQIIRDIVPDLEAQANEILSTMTGGRMRLQYRTERTLKSNKNREVATLDIVITDADAGELPYLSRSGGQKVRAALAQAFAMAMIKASRVGLQLGFLFIDEPPGLDEEGTEGYCAALETIHNMIPGMKVIAISHDERMKARFAKQLTVVSTANGSKVVTS